jgi:phenylacetate-coenzyme A ligase PaaK-like adenylate-forming protein
MDEARATSIIGLPVQLLSLARHPSALAEGAFRRLRSIVLCSDHVSDSIMRALRLKSDGQIFQHYGSTEMGLGGGVDCSAHTGYHMREADLYFEIIAPDTGKSLPDGEFGEVVFTTLARTGMPLIRYRTGDISRILPGPCPCGSVITRFDRVRERVSGSISIGVHGTISIATLDETLFDISGLLDFTASFVKGTPSHLDISVYGYGAARSESVVRKSLLAIPSIGAACAADELRLKVQLSDDPFPVTGAKRTIQVHQVQ